MKKNILFLIAISVLALSACTDDEPELGVAPTAADAAFTYSASATSPNILEFKAARTDVVAVWDFGNGTTGEGPNGVGTYPNAGTYAVTLTIFTKGGSAKRTDSVVIAADDPTLLNDPLFRLLTGGTDSLNGKTWVIDSANGGHFGVTYNEQGVFGYLPNDYSADPGNHAGMGMYDDRYNFSIFAFQFNMITNGNVFIDDNQAGNFPGSTKISNSDDFIAPVANKIGQTWTITKGVDTTLTVSEGSFLGFYTGARVYTILNLTENELYLRYADASNSNLNWYLKLIPEGYVPGSGGGGSGGGGSTGVELPIDFEGTDPGFESFNGSTASVVSNPNSTGINTSANVLQTIKGGSNDAGIYVDLGSKLDFSTNTKIAFKLFNSTNPFVGGTCRVKLEDQSNPQNSVEVDVTLVATPAWIQYEADFAGSASGQYDRIVFFPGWATTGTDTYNIDDIEQR